MFTVYEASVSQ